MTEDQAIDAAQVILQTSNPNVETAQALLLLEDEIDEEIFGDLWEALVAILPPIEFLELQKLNL
jgi:hypothetical protein